MKKSLIFILLIGSFFCGVYAQTDTISSYTKKTYMIPMRDGVKLFTVVLAPTQEMAPGPFLIKRTPYGADFPLPENAIIPVKKMGSFQPMAEDGYIFVFQDMRGKFKSEGSFEMTRPLYHLIDKTKTDESTDAYDAIDWLVKNIKNNNGKAGINGVSYPGYLALDASVDPHPALKASSPQASPADMFLGDDFHHNGAFRLSYGFEYSYLVENDKLSNSNFPFPQYDLYNWYLQLGSLKNVNDKYYKGRLAAWNDFIKHPDYDDYWKKSSTLTYIQTPQLPILHVGGYFDQEDMNGPQLMYRHLEKKDSFNRNFIVLGPWNHGGWEDQKADSLGEINFGSNTAAWFQALQKRWFDYWLRGIGDGKFVEASCFQTGSNIWKTYDSWPPKNAVMKKLYATSEHKASFIQPSSATGAVSYVSDPATPVPYRSLPIEATYGEGSRWYTWHVEDQRFVTTRPDVVSFIMDSLTENETVTGKVMAHLFASTTGTDADFVVKLIDVYPAFDTGNRKMSGYQLPVAMEVIRGRYRKSFMQPSPLVPGKAEEFVIDLHDINHTFLKGHQMMIQVQSTWFPIIDRNPQKYVPSIFEAKESDFIKATETVYCNKQYASYVELPVMKE
ncbi:CocE/NonD family hydrolase [Ferruginibacter paludis]|uniref:CocE/NonD family hydrolase n=1 Tax=Ferruginibacter paludis TaxID=1310417 RepID=UPI0025B4C2A6|nr:CocE/NonD family hydrolase [Ferruginibacter paludis]MDN3658599.1 CocE/NonD family hydrolase [Ferruginibacter paludis]